MNDIVKKLGGPFLAERAALRVMKEAADEIDRLRAESAETDAEFDVLQHDLGKALLEMDRLRAALEEISDRHVPDQPSCLDIDEADYIQRQHTELRRMARAALDGKA